MPKKITRNEADYRYNKASFLAIVGLTLYGIVYAMYSTKEPNIISNIPAVALIGSIFWLGGIFNYSEYLNLMHTEKNTKLRCDFKTIKIVALGIPKAAWEFFF